MAKSSNQLEKQIRKRLKKRTRKSKTPILLMSHMVLGHPSLEENAQVIDAMVKGGVDIMELQIPFTEPYADGPVIAAANQKALDGGLRVDQALEFLANTTRKHAIPFLVMTYCNIMLARGIKRFVDEVADRGGVGLIIPDLPLEEAQEAIEACNRRGLAWVQLMTPTCPDQRLAELGQAASGFCYVVARKGVTGKQTSFGDELDTLLARCRKATTSPLAVGFGVRSAEDVAFLAGRADIAVVGTASIQIHEQHGVAAVGKFFAGLRDLEG
ncbi:MAG: tryptophan synthase subunit alpha [Magnetococcales bacterium]|nr:tryptophan synthase subunit alpha [Magnetococcales bacterium]